MPKDVNRIKTLLDAEFDLTGKGKLSTSSKPDNASFLCTLEWSWTPMNYRRESYYLKPAPAHWLLWITRYDDNYGKWQKPFVIARCSLSGLDAKAAGMSLLAAVMLEDIRRFDPTLDRFHDVSAVGMLSARDIAEVAKAVWKDGM
jgi:hypothetical protein